MDASGQPVILLFAAAPQLGALEAALAEAGLPVARVATTEAARQVLAANRGACIAVLDTNPAAPYSVDSAYRLLHQAPPVPTLLLFDLAANPLLDPESISPVDDYAYLQDPVEELVRRVQVLSRRVALATPAAALPGGTRRFQQGQSIVVYGPKGGVGCSTIAVNLAVALARLYQKEVALIDADLWFGDVSVLLDVRSRQSISSVLDNLHALDAEYLKSVLVPHPSGVHVLRAPTALMSVEAIPDHLPARLAMLCRALFDFVIVDTQCSLQEYVLQLLEGASQIMLVTTPELSAIRSTARLLEVAPGLGWTNKLLLVLNRANSGLPPAAIEDTIGRKIDATLVSADRCVAEAANTGQPLLLMDPKGRERITRDFGRLAARIADEPEPRWESGLWDRALALLGRGPRTDEEGTARRAPLALPPVAGDGAPPPAAAPEHGDGGAARRGTEGQPHEGAPAHRPRPDRPDATTMLHAVGTDALTDTPGTSPNGRRWGQ